MEETYMSQIWEIIGSKENQNLTVKEQQDRIFEVLFNMKLEVQELTKSKFKKDCIKAIEDSLNGL